MTLLDRQIEDLIAAAGLDDDDADDLRAAMAEVQARKDARLRGDVQRAVGETHLTLRDKMDQVIALQIDTRGILDTLVQQQEAQGAALGTARAEFQGWINEVGERVSQDVGELRKEIAVVSDDVAVVKEEVISHSQRLTRLEKGQSRIRQEFKADLNELNTRHGQQIEAFKEAFIASSKEEARRYKALLDELIRERQAGKEE